MDRKVTQMKCVGSARSGWETSWIKFPGWVPGVSVAGSSGLGGTFACEVTLVGRIIFLGLSFLFYTTKGALTFSDLVEVLGGRNKLMFGRPV